MRTHIWVVAALLAGAGATTPASEVAALRDFYGALGGDGWVDSDGWTSARDPCGGSSEPCVLARGSFEVHLFPSVYVSTKWNEMGAAHKNGRC